MGRTNLRHLLDGEAGSKILALIEVSLCSEDRKTHPRPLSRGEAGSKILALIEVSQCSEVSQDRKTHPRPLSRGEAGSEILSVIEVIQCSELWQNHPHYALYQPEREASPLLRKDLEVCEVHRSRPHKNKIYFFGLFVISRYAFPVRESPAIVPVAEHIPSQYGNDKPIRRNTSSWAG